MNPGGNIKLLGKKQFPWLNRDPEKRNDAYCKMCRKIVAPRKAVIVQHSKIKEHTQRINAQTQSLN